MIVKLKNWSNLYLDIKLSKIWPSLKIWIRLILLKILVNIKDQLET